MKAPLLAPGVLALALASASGLAQITPPKHASLIAKFDPAGQAYNDVWGYVSPSGGEYAILGTQTGVFVVDCTDPQNPVQRAFIHGPNSTWRDMRSYGHYVYVVTEGGGGVQIIDMIDPDNPRLVKTWGQSVFSHAHNVAIDTGTGMLYACGTNNGTPIIDLSQDPENPVHIGNYTAAYVHDLQVQDGYAHLGEISSAQYTILDVSSLPATTQLGSARVNSCHNAWPSRDGLIAVATSEVLAGLSVFDISDKRLPVRTGVYFVGGFATVHNAYVRDRVCHMSYYTEGYVAVDVSDATVIRRLARYDTSSVAGAGFGGAWGCYPFQPSGVIYISDQTEGLHLIDSLASNRRFGRATAGTTAAPTIHTFGAAHYLNRNFKIELENAAPNAQASLLIGVAQSTSQVLGVEVQVDLTQPLLIANARTDASGKAAISLSTIPPVTTVLYAQWLVLDGGAATGIAATRGLRFNVFPTD